MIVFIELLHNNPSITTLQAFVDDIAIKLDNTFTINDLLTYEGNDVRIKASYVKNSNDAASIGRLDSPTLIRVPIERVGKEFISTAGNLVVPNNDFKAFLSDGIKELIKSPDYVPLNRNTANLGANSSVYRIANNATVWVWCKALGEDGEKGKLLNLTPFIESLTTTINKQGGNFSVKLLPLMAKYQRAFSYDKQGGWEIDTNHLMKYFYRGTDNYLQRYPTHQVTSEGLKRSRLFFHNVITQNDVLFIQFETLKLEEKQRAADEFGLPQTSNDLFINPSELVGRNWDMIALVDDNKSSYNAAAADMSVEVIGRDLMKILIEDGCYFFPFDFATEKGGFVNASDDKGSLKRLINGELAFFNSYVDRTIEFTIRFVFNQLANIEIVDSSLFQYYLEQVYKYDIIEKQPNQQQNTSVAGNVYEQDSNFKKVLVDGIWQCVRVIIDGEIANRRIVDSSISSDSGSLLSFIQKVCQDPFVEFWGETYGENYFFIARKPPFTGRAIKSYLDDGVVFDVLEDDIYSENLSFTDGDAYSWYRIIPKGNFFGDGNGITLAEFPAIYFEEYAKIWGSRPMSVVSNYIDYQGVASVNKSVNLDFLKDQAIQDLAYIIETHAYLPFTRRGSITLKGDRRLKRGMFLRHGGTNEIYHIDGVNQAYSHSAQSNDRTTVVQVSRGMREEYLDESNVHSYFKIIDLDKDPATGKSRSNNFKINKDTFNFFLTRSQFKI